MNRALSMGMLLGLFLVGLCLPAHADDAKFDLTGNWDFQTDVGGQKGTPQFLLKLEGNKLTGQYRGQFGESELNGSVHGDKVEFRFTTPNGPANYTGTVAHKDHMQGTADYGAGNSGTWTGQRGSGQPAPATVAAEGRLKEIAKLLGSGDVAEIKKYAAENFAPNFVSIPIERHLGFFLGNYDANRGLEFHSIQETRPNQVVGLFKSKLIGRWVALNVGVEPESPYRITGLGTVPPRPPAGAMTATKKSDEQIRQEMQALMTKLAEADQFSGAVLLARDDVPVFSGAFGMANKDFNVPNQVATKFNLGSMNKMMTAVAVAQLVERGKLSFDDPLAKFLPDFPDAESSKKITVKHLLSHTAGLGGYFSPAWRNSSRAIYRTVDDMLKRAAADEKLLFEPGTRYQYSNTGMLVLGKVIEVVSGQDYFEYIRENITGPTGMASTACYELDQVNVNLAVGYDKQYGENGVTFRNNLFEHVMRGGPMGGGYSTVEDLLKFDRALRANKLVGAEYVKILLSAKPELNAPNYGYGFAVNAQQKIAGHSGGFAGINSNLDMFLDSGWTAAVMSNYSNGASIPLQAMRELVANDLKATSLPSR